MKKSEREREVVIPEDILDIILKFLPLKALYRSKVVSKSWASLIQQLEIRRPPLFVGFFYKVRSGHARLWRKSSGYMKSAHRIFRYIDRRGGIHNSSIDPTLSFSPLRGGQVIDCCNGLVLYRHGFDFFVCNPLTKSWTQLSTFDICVCLDFDPQVSPHFKIVSFRVTRINFQRFSVYSSETRRWSTYASFRPSYYSMQMDRNRDYAYWKGSLYLVLTSITDMESYDHWGSSGKIMRFDLLDHGGEREQEGHHDAYCQATELEFPVGTEKKPDRVCLARGWRDKLCFAGFDLIHNDTELRVRVWSLSTRDQVVWTMEHDHVLPCNLLRGYNPHKRRSLPVVVGFHPFLNGVVFIMRGNTLYALDLMNLSLHEVCPIGYGPWKSGEATVYPFSACSVDSLESRQQEQQH